MPEKEKCYCMENHSRRERDLSLDAIAGLFIILMIFQHFNINTRAPFTIGHIFMFNTSWFFFKSGMFHRPERIDKSTIVKWSRRLMVPFVTCSLFGGIMALMCERIETGHFNLSILPGLVGQICMFGAPWWNIPVWFLLTLFVVKVVTARYHGRNTWIYVLVSLVICLGHHYMVNTGRFNYIGNMALATLFYVLGYKTKDMDFSSHKSLYTLAAVFVIIFFIYPSALDIWSNKALYGNYLLSILSAVVGIMLVNRIFKVCKFLQIKPLLFMGQNAMLFLVLHVPFYLAFCELYGRTNLAYSTMNWCGAFVSVVCCFAMCLFFDRHKHLKWIIGG